MTGKTEIDANGRITDSWVLVFFASKRNKKRDSNADRLKSPLSIVEPYPLVAP